ncbi:hypothetical protein PpBr36_01557 [Pyricularia pennisetigena]|uniref:hypothetical protein n=1 Tax=Pyricularia pennisetigena TaxID=1578925 RepID=UPI00114DFB9A|nr:hypothetical protein PpBr36_01557 [Pyricularia pennisetigena]TLS29299.1 hypothetical protein PpBr36_01557 [Pyricularia pennisetigena]
MTSIRSFGSRRVTAGRTRTTTSPYTTTRGGMHNHVLRFKLDLDVPDAANKAELVCSLRRSVIADEEHGWLDWDTEGDTQLLVVNTSAENKFGENRESRVVPQGAGKLTAPLEQHLRYVALWAEHEVHVGRQKDEERQPRG